MPLGTDLSSSQASNDDGLHLDVIVLLLLVLLVLVILTGLAETRGGDDLVGELNDGSTRRVREVLGQGGVGKGEVPGDGHRVLLSL
jgi:hypothetical protein